MIIKSQTQYCPIPGSEWEQRLKGRLSTGHLRHNSVFITSCTRDQTKHSDPDAHFTIPLNPMQPSLLLYSSNCLGNSHLCVLRLSDTFQVHKSGIMDWFLCFYLHWGLCWFLSALGFVKPYLVLVQAGKTLVSCHTDLHCCHFCAFNVTHFFYLKLLLQVVSAEMYCISIRFAKQAN